MKQIQIAAAILVLSIVGGCYDPEMGSSAEIMEQLEDGAENSSRGEVLETCPSAGPEFDGVKSGDRCAFSGGCGGGEFNVDLAYYYSDEAEELIARDVYCANDVLSVKSTYIVADLPPRPEVQWEDCSALDDGRTGEPCLGGFSCFGESADGCLEKVFCTDNFDGLVRLAFCDKQQEVLDEERPVVKGCAEADDAIQYDPCSGEFLCDCGYYDAENGPTECSPIASCDSEGEYCSSTDDHTGSSYGWCDGAVLHFISGGASLNI